MIKIYRHLQSVHRVQRVISFNAIYRICTFPIVCLRFNCLIINFQLSLDFNQFLKLSMETSNVSKKQLPDQRAGNNPKLHTFLL